MTHEHGSMPRQTVPGPVDGRPRWSLDRRFFLWLYAALTAIGLLQIALASSLAERILWLVFTIAEFAQATKKWRDLRRDGRWMRPPDAAAQAVMQQRRTIMLVALPILFAAGFIVGLS